MAVGMVSRQIYWPFCNLIIGMNYENLIPTVKLESQTQVCILQRLLMFGSFGDDSQVNALATIQLLWNENFGFSNPSNQW